VLMMGADIFLVLTLFGGVVAALGGWTVVQLWLDNRRLYKAKLRKELAEAREAEDREINEQLRNEPGLHDVRKHLRDKDHV